jgi:hypothetical protein
MIQIPAGQNFDVRIKRRLEYFQHGYGVAIMSSGVTGGGAVELLGDEWQGLALDFLTNTYAWRVASQAEQLLGPGPYSVEPGMGISFLDNSYALGIS